MGTRRILWEKVNPDYEILFRLMHRLRHDAEQCYWIRERGAERDIVDIGEDSGHIATEVKIDLPVSHNTLTIKVLGLKRVSVKTSSPGSHPGEQTIKSTISNPQPKIKRRRGWVSSQQDITFPLRNDIGWHLWITIR